MVFSYNWLQSFFEKKLPAPGKIADALTMHSFEAKGVKDIRYPSAGKDVVLDIDVPPNRAHDCLCHLGIAKEISTLFNLKLKPAAKNKLNILKGKTQNYLKLEIKEPQLCRRYIAAVMLNVKVGPSPLWMQERLMAAGQKPINSVVDAANYVMLEMGQPLHAFDMDKMGAKPTIIVRLAEKGESITTLDDKDFELDETMLVIADGPPAGGPLAIAGIKGGKKAEIDKTTKNIILEAANFEPVNIRLTSQKLGLRTGASAGFENEISPNIAVSAMERLMSLIQATSGGAVVSEKIDFYPQKVIPPRVSFNQDDISRLLGIEIPEKEIISILNRLGFNPKKTKKIITINSPVERLDLNLKEDVAEEIARIYGYENIPARIPEGLLAPSPQNDNYFYENVIRDLFARAGFSEVYNYSFSPSGQVRIENPVSEDKKFLRESLLDSLKNNASQNLKYFDSVKIFEIGKIFRKSEGAVKEKNSLAGLIGCKPSKKNGGEFFELKGALEMIFSELGITDHWFDDSPEAAEVKSDHFLGLAEIKIGERGIGFIDLNAFELDLDELIKLTTEEIEYRPISRYPAVTRDVAILVSLKTKVIEVLDVIENTAGSLLIDTDLFDIYEGGELGENRKSFAFRLVFQSKERTLSDKEINALMEKIIKALDSVTDWEVRKK